MDNAHAPSLAGGCSQLWVTALLRAMCEVKSELVQLMFGDGATRRIGLTSLSSSNASGICGAAGTHRRRDLAGLMV